jgi:type II secretory pathway component PulM
MMPFTPRERWLSIGLTLALGVWALYALALRPAGDRIRTLERLVPQQQTQLRDLQAKSLQYTQLHEELAHARARIASEDPNFEVLPFLEKLIDRQKLTSHLVTMNPEPLQPQAGELTVTLELKEISWRELIDLLRAVETAQSAVRVGSLHLRKSAKNEALLDSTVGICSPKFDPSALATQTTR